MANVEINDLTLKATPAGTDEIELQETAGGDSKKATLTSLSALFQAQGDVLDDLNTLGAATADGEFLVATAAGAFAYETGATARTSLGLGTSSTVDTGTASGEVPLVGTKSATLTLAGLVEQSTSAENVTGTDDTVFPSVAGTKEMIDTHATGGVDGIVSTATGTVLTLSDATSAFTNDMTLVSGATTANASTITADSLTTGKGFEVMSASTSSSTRDMVNFFNDSTSATGTTVLNLRQDSAGDAFSIDHNANGRCIFIKSDATGTDLIRVDNPATTTGSIFFGNANSLTSGRLMRLTSSSTSTTARNLLDVANESSSATNAVVLKLSQASSAPASEFAKGTTDGGFINFTATADADTTSSISTLNTSGATTDHIQIELNGTKAWIAVSTNNPS